jgi:hypothetical protein
MRNVRAFFAVSVLVGAAACSKAFTASSGQGDAAARDSGSGDAGALDSSMALTDADATTMMMNDASIESDASEDASVDGDAAVTVTAHLYVMGGATLTNPDGGANGSIYATTDVFVAAVYSDGSLSQWSSGESLPDSVSINAGASITPLIFSIGGQSGDGTFVSNAYASFVVADGGMQEWTVLEHFSTPRIRHSVATSNKFLYVMGGLGYDNTFLSDVQYATGTGSGTLGAFANTTALPAPRHRQASAASAAYVFVTGGSDAPDAGVVGRNDVLESPVLDNGMLGPWTSVATFQTGRYLHQAVVHAGVLIVLGGMSNAGEYLADVQSSSIGSGGDAGALQQFNEQPKFGIARQAFASVVVADTLYVIGGDNGGANYLTDVTYAKLGAGGHIASWTTGPPLPKGRAFMAVGVR